MVCGRDGALIIGTGKRLTMTGRNVFEIRFFLESDIKIDVYIYNYIYIASLDGFQKSIFPNNYLYTMGDLKLWIFLNLIIALKPGSDEIRFRN